MEKGYIPKANQEDFCETIGLCSVRRDNNGVNKVGIKNLSGEITEENLDEIINSDIYKGKKIIRVYSSGHIFLSDNKEVFLVTTEKNGKIQHQFTGGSPIEEKNKEVIFKEDNIYKFDIQKVRENAKIRTKNRTGVEVIEEYNKKPIVDWVLIENEENGETFYKLVCLMHFIVKKYTGNLSYTGKEYTTGGKWYNIDELINTSNIAPNAHIVSKKAVEMMGRLDKTIIVTDFSKTLTSSLNSTTWSIFAKSGFLGEKYTIERNNYYNLFHNYEIKGDIEKTKEWWDKHLSLFIKYGLTKEILNKVINNDYFEKREGLDDFMVNLQNRNIKLVIISSGILDVIKIFLSKNGFSQTNIEIFSNKLLFNPNGEVIGFDKRNIITTLDKNNYESDFDMYGKVILLGDDKSDLSMYNGNCLKIGFCDSNKVNGYDLYLGDNGNINDVLKYI